MMGPMGHDNVAVLVILRVLGVSMIPLGIFSLMKIGLSLAHDLLARC